MNKKKFLDILLILMPILAVGLATTVDSVTVFDTATGQTEYYSYFDILPVTNLQMIPALAAMLSGLSGILAAVYLAKKNVGMRKASGWCAMGAACAAAIPTVVRGSVLVIPNVALPIFMLIQYLVAVTGLKKTNSDDENRSPRRLEKR